MGGGGGEGACKPSSNYSKCTYMAFLVDFEPL